MISSHERNKTNLHYYSVYAYVLFALCLLILLCVVEFSCSEAAIDSYGLLSWTLLIDLTYWPRLNEWSRKLIASRGVVRSCHIWELT